MLQTDIVRELGPLLHCSEGGVSHAIRALAMFVTVLARSVPSTTRKATGRAGEERRPLRGVAPISCVHVYGSRRRSNLASGAFGTIDAVCGGETDTTQLLQKHEASKEVTLAIPVQVHVAATDRP